MFSSLARGCGTLDGQLRLEAWAEEKIKDNGPLFPSILHEETFHLTPLADHRHGITVSPRAKSAFSSRAKSAISARSVPTEKTDGELVLPKTFVTRKGALLIFTDNELELSEKEREYIKSANKMFKNKYADYTSKLGSISRLTQSVLTFGDQESLEDEGRSVTDPDNKVFVGFMKDLDKKGIDLHARPGGDVNFYLRDLKSRATSARSRFDTRTEGKASVDNVSLAESQDIDDLESIASSTTRVQSAKSSRSVLSADKLAASLKSSGYLGRPTPQAPTPILESVEGEAPSPYVNARSRPQSGRSRPHSGKSLSRSVRSRPQSGRSRPHSGKARSLSKSSLLAGGVSNIPEGIEAPAPAEGIRHRSMHESDPSLHDSLLHGDAYINEDDGMHDPDLFDTQSVSSSLFQEQDILLPNEQEDDGMEDGRYEGYKHSSHGSRKPSQTSMYSRRSRSAASMAGGDAEEDVFSVKDSGAAQPLMAAYQSGLMSAASGTFSLGDTHADAIKEEDVVIDNTHSHMLSHTESLASMMKPQTPQDETLEDLKGLRSGRESIASSHSGMTTERARTVLAEEGISSEGIDRRRSSSASHVHQSPAPHTPSDVHPSRPTSASHSRPGSAQVRARPSSGSQPPSRPGSSTKPRSRPGSSKSFQEEGEDRADTPAPPSSPALSRAQSPKPKEPSSQAKSEVHTTDDSAERKTSETGEGSKDTSKEAEPNKDSLTTSVSPKPAMSPALSASGPRGVTPTKAEGPAPRETSPKIGSQAPSASPAPSGKAAGGKSSPALVDSNKEVSRSSRSEEDLRPVEPEVETQMTVIDGKETSTKPSKETKPTPAKETKAAAKPSPAPKKQYSKALDINQVPTPGKKDKKSDLKKAAPAKAPEKPKDLMAELEEMYKTMPKEEKKAPEQKQREEEKKSILKKTTKPPTPIIPEKSKEEKEYEELQKEVGNILESTTADQLDEDSVGFSPEELELQKKMLEEKMAKAQERLKGNDEPEKGKGKKGGSKSRDKSPPKKSGKKKQATSGAASEGGEKKSLEEQREALRQAKLLEKQKRLEEAKNLEDKIKNKEAEKQKKIEDAKRKKQQALKTSRSNSLKSEARSSVTSISMFDSGIGDSESNFDARSVVTPDDASEYASSLMEEEVRAKKAEAAAAKEAEEEAREMLAATRKAQREEREAKRKAEVERRKEQAAQRRADQKAREEAARKREVDMLMRIADAEEKRRLQEEERKRKEEEEEREREQREEDERLALKALEEEEEKIAELERQAEEEAMARLIEEREEAERERREMEEEARRLAVEEERKRMQLEEEQRRLEDEARKREEDEARRREDERQRLLELQKMEEEARDRMKFEMEKRREAALQRREVNLERKSHLSGLKNGQGITKPWVFSYYVLWPRETYEKLMGEDPKKKKGFRPPPKKPKPAS